MRVEGEADGRLDPQDALEFYGIGADTPWSDTGVYWLRNKETGVARRIAAPALEPIPPPSGPASYRHTVERRDRSFYFAALRNGEFDNFFGPMVASQPAVLAVELASSALPDHIDMGLTLQGVAGGS